jgi:hypothetical protein
MMQRRAAQTTPQRKDYGLTVPKAFGLHKVVIVIHGTLLQAPRRFEAFFYS